MHLVDFWVGNVRDFRKFRIFEFLIRVYIFRINKFGTRVWFGCWVRIQFRIVVGIPILQISGYEAGVLRTPLSALQRVPQFCSTTSPRTIGEKIGVLGRSALTWGLKTKLPQDWSTQMDHGLVLREYQLLTFRNRRVTKNQASFFHDPQFSKFWSQKLNFCSSSKIEKFDRRGRIWGCSYIFPALPGAPRWRSCPYTWLVEWLHRRVIPGQGILLHDFAAGDV